jgi:hypothetical protein
MMMNEMVLLYVLMMLVMIVIGVAAFIVCIKIFMNTMKDTYFRGGWSDGSTVQVQEPEGLEPDSQGDESGSGKAAYDRDGSAGAAREAEKERNLRDRISKPAKPVVRFGEEDD